MFNKRTSNNNNVIFIDIDDTLCDTRGAFAEIYTEITGEPVDKMNVRDYEDMCPLWTQDEEVAKIFQHGKDLYAKAKPMPGAKEGVAKLLKEGYKIKVVSLNFPQSVYYKHMWVERHFPELVDDVIILTSAKTNKDIFKGHAIIDDDLKNIKNNPSTYPILLDFYCIYEDLDYPHKYNSWKDIVDKF